MNERDSVKKAINAFYKGAGVNVTFNGEVNKKVAEVFGEMILKTQACSDAFNWVPRPTGGKATITWVAKNFTRSVLEQLEKKQSLTCAKTVIWSYRRKIQLASAGI